ncbi:hypothetical protein B0J14DRAFT_75838 [Halenospora varia]|nr:hypothetical protein B0J14DRAFT_75838 [Halenospora varia]
MSQFKGPTSITNAVCTDFMSTQLPLYSGSLVTISVGKDGPKHKVLKALICDKSPYFAAMFAEGAFKEGEDQEATLELVEGVVSETSLSMLIQWLYTGMVSMKECSTTEEAISHALEFARYADFAGLDAVGEVVAKYIRTAIITNYDNDGPSYGRSRYDIESQHIIFAFSLPKGHPIRRMLATACVQDYMRGRELELWKVIEQVPEFAVELSIVIREVLGTLTSDRHCNITFKDPFTEKEMKVG